MPLDSMTPNPVWVADAYAETVAVLEAYSDEVTYNVWGGDWCKDTTAQLPDFAAALEAAGVPDGRIEVHVVDEDKRGPGVETYEIERIPTVVLERDGEELSRFVEREGEPIAVWAADQLTEQLGAPPAIDD